MENCRQGGHRNVGFRPELHENWYGTRENVSFDTEVNTIPNNGESIITDIKSVTSSLFDLSLQNMKYVTQYLDNK